jgi:hypothetical protein
MSRCRAGRRPGAGCGPSSARVALQPSFGPQAGRDPLEPVGAHRNNRTWLDAPDAYPRFRCSTVARGSCCRLPPASRSMTRRRRAGESRGDSTSTRERCWSARPSTAPSSGSVWASARLPPGPQSYRRSGLVASLHSDPPFADVEPGMGIGIGCGRSGFAIWTQGVPGVTTMVWSSADGRSWDAGTELPVPMLHGVASIGQGLIAYGRLEEADAGISVPCDKDDVVGGRCRTVPAVWTLERVR